MRARWLCLAALAAVAPAVAGCGGVGVSGASEATGNQLTIYSSLPLQGPAAAISQQIVNGEKLALSRGRRARRPVQGRLRLARRRQPEDRHSSTPERPRPNAKTAAQDTSTIAYLGELGSAATAVSLPLINAAGILQVSPAAPTSG